MLMLATPMAGLALMVTLQKVEEWLLGREEVAPLQTASRPSARAGRVEDRSTGGVTQRG